jgi:hypothetical protein
LASCENINNDLGYDDNSTVPCSLVEKQMTLKFNCTLRDMLVGITSLIQQNKLHTPLETTVDEGDYISPSSTTTDLYQLQKDCAGQFKDLRKSLGERSLVIHVDDCQLFFRGIVTSRPHTNTTILAGEIMSLALRCFSRCITPFTNHRNIVWVFSGKSHYQA